MRVDLESLASFSQTGDRGGVRAADSLEALTGVPAYCDLTRTTLVDGEGLASFLGDASTRIEVPFDGALSGRALVSYEKPFAARIAEELGMGSGALPEVANILTSGFVDVWAEQAESTIDIQPPRPVEDDARVLEDAAVADGSAFVFESHVELADGDGTCRFAVLPDVEPFVDYLEAGSEDVTLSPGELAAYVQLTAESASAVADHLAAMTGIDANGVESHLDFVPVERVPSLLDDAAYEGAVFESEGGLNTVIAVLFDESEQGAVADAMLPGSDHDPSMAQSAVAELGNVTASGVLDGWANAIDTSIDISTPSHVHDDGRAVLDTVAAAYGRHADAIAVVDATVALDEDVTCRVCAFPDPQDADTVAEIASELTGDETVPEFPPEDAGGGGE
ncbi:chemotaxis protein CheC [Halobacterium bonnevillei]|uniref:Chemotaxis protein CheC n=1 Tax=Halobacterium bonnevillei TaxID=2692200 RepID=A0A6B0SHA2_9EURY|nr:chemotaxis protein CheC [Halobacterium bonnevillei]MXR21028.1 chemotaxis protein CheC [Halobacterium bonnevillei]